MRVSALACNCSSGVHCAVLFAISYNSCWFVSVSCITKSVIAAVVDLGCDCWSVVCYICLSLLLSLCVQNKRMRCLIVIAAVFCCVGCSSVGSTEKCQVPLPAIPDEPCTFTELQCCNHSLWSINATIGQQLLDVFASCGFNDEAQLREEKCGRNETGRFRYELRENSTLTGFAKLVASSCGSSATFCGFSCNSSLQQLRDNTGCCANFLLTDDCVRSGNQRNPNLWSDCNLQHPNDCPSSLSFMQTQNDVVCSRAEITYCLNRLNSNPDYVTLFVDLLRSCGFRQFAQIQVINRCDVTRYGIFCFEAEATASRLVGEVQSQCFPTAQECTVSCKVALDMYWTEADCCFNCYYAHTAIVS